MDLDECMTSRRSPVCECTAVEDSLNAAFLAECCRKCDHGAAVNAGQALASQVVKECGALVTTV